MTQAGHPVCRVRDGMERARRGQGDLAGNDGGQSRENGEKRKTAKYPLIHLSRPCLLSTYCVPRTVLGTDGEPASLGH